MSSEKSAEVSKYEQWKIGRSFKIYEQWVNIDDIFPFKKEVDIRFEVWPKEFEMKFSLRQSISVGTKVSELQGHTKRYRKRPYSKHTHIFTIFTYSSLLTIHEKPFKISNDKSTFTAFNLITFWLWSDHSPKNYNSNYQHQMGISRMKTVLKVG